MAGESHTRRKKFQPRNGGTRDRRSRARSFNANYNSLRRWRPLRPRCRKFATNGLYQREIHDRWLQSLESGRIADDKLTGTSWGREIDAAGYRIYDRRRRRDKLPVRAYK